MQKYLWPVGLIVICCGVAFFIGKNQSSKLAEEKQNLKAQKQFLTKNLNRAKVPSANLAPEKPKKDSVQKMLLPLEFDILESSQGSDLFVSLFENKILKNCEEACFGPIQKRFSQPYRDFNMGARNYADFEVRARMGILKAMPEMAKPGSFAFKARVEKFYQKIVFDPKQPFVLQRQALFNLRDHMKSKSENERRAILARLPASLVATGGLTERELLDEVVRGAK